MTTNSLNLIYREIPLDDSEEIKISSVNNVYSEVRQRIKPQFSDWQLKPNNVNGMGAAGFNRRVGRFKHDWLDFKILSYKENNEDIPSEADLKALGILTEENFAEEFEWPKAIKEEVAKGELYLLVGLEALIPQNKFRISMLTSGLPSNCWPCQFRIFEYVITNAPIVQIVRYRSNVLV